MSKIGRDAISYLTNDMVFRNWQRCNKDGRQKAADYWYGFLASRAKSGDKAAQLVVEKMDRLR